VDGLNDVGSDGCREDGRQRVGLALHNLAITPEDADCWTRRHLERLNEVQSQNNACNPVAQELKGERVRQARERAISALNKPVASKCKVAVRK
jgi:hypothetical protein